MTVTLINILTIGDDEGFQWFHDFHYPLLCIRLRCFLGFVPHSSSIQCARLSILYYHKVSQVSFENKMSGLLALATDLPKV